MAIDAKNLVVAAKVYSRGVALPLDASSVYESLGEAQTYAASPIAYAGQIITVLQDGAYKAYVLDGSAGAYTLTPLGSGSEEPVEVKNYVQIVTELPGEGQEQGVIYINTTDNKGYIYNGTDYQVVFENVESPDGESLSEQLAALETALEEKADLAGATFTGTVTLSADPTQNMEAVTKQYVDRLISGINSFEVGVVDSSTPLPAEGYKAGQAFRVAEAGTYAGQACELGDLIICIKDYAEGASDADFMVVQSNLNGVVIGPDASTDANIAVFDGITGKKIKDSAVTLTSLQDAIAKAHEHTNKTILDSFTKNETELLSEVDSKISTATATYGDGEIKNDNLGQPSPDGQIKAGSKNSANLVFTGQRNMFYGTGVGAAPQATSESVRGLSSTKLNPTQGYSFNITVAQGQQFVRIAYPATLRKIIKCFYVEQNTDLAENFAETTVSVYGASGAAGAD